MERHTKPRRVRIVLVLSFGLVILMVLAWRLLSPETKSLPELFEGNVVSVDIIEYKYGSIPEVVNRTTVTSPELIQEIARRFNEMPVSPFRDDLKTLTGGDATVRSFHFADGSRLDTLSVFIESHNVVEFWPDGSVTRTTWGRPLNGYYDELGSVTQIPGTEIPTF